MVLCLHQRNDYIKRKLGLWRVQKYIPLIGAISTLICTGPQTTATHIRQHRAEYGILWKSGATFRHGAVFAQKQSLYQREARALEIPKMYSSRRCNNRTYLCVSQATPTHVRQYMAEYGILGKSGATFRHSALFAPKQ